ncbi:type II secretion system protein [Deinococcus sp. 12RED42]|uniref:PulJ/GspJ family protein n=1 Tax=Deinococcus sp. 12RED42 TaxID=2745872 RepID=UPI001E31AA7C|nr:type II secretion system protein [Deinococcus sp. 12RED42]
MNGTQRGFTLVEILVAIAILGIVLASIGAVLPGLAGVNRASSDEQRAVLAARAYFEQVRATLNSNFNADVTTIDIPGNNAGGLSCTPTSVTSTDGNTRTVTLGCKVNSWQNNFTLTVANPALGGAK